MQLLEFTPVYLERVWGGRSFESKLGRVLPEGKTIGESWEIVDRAEQQSVVPDGEFSGKTLRTLLHRYASDILGPGSDPQKPFPILVKWLDCRQRLSLQVHPADGVATRLNGEPKTENWYIADADADASITVGLKKGVTRKRFETKLAAGEFEDCVCTLPTHKGDSMFVESGCVHAINAGNLILEIQQNSDTTYRVHDWNRLGLDGAPRQLHIKKSLQSINFDLPEPKLLSPCPGEQLLAHCSAFRIRKFDLASGDAPISLPHSEQPRLVHIISGKALDQVSGKILHRSKNYLQPYITELSLVAQNNATLLITDLF